MLWLDRVDHLYHSHKHKSVLLWKMDQHFLIEELNCSNITATVTRMRQIPVKYLPASLYTVFYVKNIDYKKTHKLPHNLEIWMRNKG